MSGKENRS